MAGLLTPFCGPHEPSQFPSGKFIKPKRYSGGGRAGIDKCRTSFPFHLNIQTPIQHNKSLVACGQ